MNFKHTLLTAAVLALTTVGAAQAQNAGAAKYGDKQGEITTPNQDKGSMSRGTSTVENRADVKAQAATANTSGTAAKGEQSTPNQGKKPMRAGASGKSREEVKADTAAARRAGSAPVGQESVKDQNKGGVAKP